MGCGVISELRLRRPKSVLFKVEGSLGEVSGTAEVAPIVLVGAESEDFFALGGEAEIGGDDRENALFREQGKEARRDKVDARESEGVKRLRRLSFRG